MSERDAARRARGFRNASLAALMVAAACGAGCGLLLPDKSVDVRMGAESAKAIAEDIGLAEHARAEDLVQGIGKRLVEHLQPASFDYHFAIIDEPSPNAFALPGGYVYVSRGLLSLVRDENELAGVISHEIEHVEARHSMKQMRSDRGLGVLALPGKVVANVISEDLANLVGAPFEMLSASHSRDQELEADTLGQALCARAGYDPAALATVLERMEQFTALETGARKTSFFDSHPSTPDRIARLARSGKALTVAASAPMTPDEADFLGRLDGMVLGADPELGVVRGRDFLHPSLDLFIEFPPDWNLTNTRRFVAAIAPKQDGVAILAVAGTGTAADLPKIAEACAADIEKKFGVKPTEIEKTTAGGVPAHALVITDTSGAEPAHIYFLWLALDGRIYQVIGMSPESHRPLIRATLDSVRPLNASELASIDVTRLRIATAKDGERVDDLSARTKNTWSAAQTAIANRLDATKPFATGQRVKIAVKEPVGKP